MCELGVDCVQNVSDAVFGEWVMMMMMMVVVVMVVLVTWRLHLRQTLFLLYSKQTNNKHPETRWGACG